MSDDILGRYSVIKKQKKKFVIVGLGALLKTGEKHFCSGCLCVGGSPL